MFSVNPFSRPRYHAFYRCAFLSVVLGLSACGGSGETSIGGGVTGTDETQNEESGSSETDETDQTTDDGSSDNTDSTDGSAGDDTTGDDTTGDDTTGDDTTGDDTTGDETTGDGTTGDDTTGDNTDDSTGSDGGGGSGYDSSNPDLPNIPLAELVSGTNTVLCGDGLDQKVGSGAEFQEVSDAVNIQHEHRVSESLWDTEASGYAMTSAAVASTSLDGDCWTDLAFSSTPTVPLAMYRNKAGHGFSAPIALPSGIESDVVSLASADLDGDELGEIVFSSFGNTDLYIMRSDASGIYSLESVPGLDVPVYGLSFADVANRGSLDLYAASENDNTDGIYFQNDGSGGLAPAGDDEFGSGLFPAPGGARSAGFSDLDLDGDADLAVAAHGKRSTLAENQDGSLLNVDVSGLVSNESAHGQVIADFTGDGLLDWFVTGVEGPGDGRDWNWGETGNRLYVNDGGFQFHDETDSANLRNAGWAWGACAADFNNDGHLDLFVENGFGHIPDGVRDKVPQDQLDSLEQKLAGYENQRPRLFINNGDGTFSEEGVSWGLNRETRGRGVVCPDFDRDGDIDLVVAQNNGPPLIYENKLPSDSGNFFSMRLHGTADNKRAIGARVRLKANGRWQTREVSANGSYLGHENHEIHFGLNGTEQIEEIRIEWPDGENSSYADIRANRFVDVRHPDHALIDSASLHSRVENARDAGLAWLNGVPTSELPSDVLMLLARAEDTGEISLGFDVKAEMDKRVDEYRANDRVEQGDKLAMFRRLYDASQPWIEETGNNLTNTNRLLITALFCGSRGVPDGYVDDLMGMVANGGYAATHALLAYWWLSDAGCDINISREELALMLKHHIAIVEDSAIGDLHNEALLILARIGREDLIPQNRLVDMLDGQTDEGGWLGSPTSSDSSAHATALGVLFLNTILRYDEIDPPFVAREKL